MGRACDGGPTRVWTAATEPSRINPPLDERRCFCDLRSATIFAHSFCAIGVTGLFRRQRKRRIKIIQGDNYSQGIQRSPMLRDVTLARKQNL